MSSYKPGFSRDKEETVYPKHFPLAAYHQLIGIYNTYKRLNAKLLKA